MDWKADYASKLATADEALKVVRSGDRVVFAHACGEPLELVDALVARAPELRDVEIVHMVAMGHGEYAKPEYAESFYHNSLFVGASTRDAVESGRGDYTPVFFSDIPGLFTGGYLPPDVVLAQVSPPDKHGWCSFGISVDYTKPACAVAKTVIALVNPNMPRTHGDAFIHVSDIDIAVESEAPVIELPPPRIGPVEEAIGKHIAGLVADGSCLQLGIGGIPDAVLLFLHERNDLGIHTEMFSEGVVDLYDEGVITNTRKTLHRDKMVASFLMGTRRLYDFVDDNPAVNMFPVNYVNDPYSSARTTTWWPSTRPSRSTSWARSWPTRSDPCSSAASAARSTSCAARPAARAASRSSLCRPPPSAARFRASSPRSAPARP
jgi:4-hydroxybutyrate CoA-transferase